MNASARLGKVVLLFELVTVGALQLLTIVLVLVATVVLFLLAIEGLRTRLVHIDTVEDLLFVVQRSIAGILTVVLGLEVLETLKAYFRDHYVRLEVILVVAIIAAGRHLVQVDFDHTSPMGLFGLSAIVIALTIGYFVVKKAIYLYPSENTPPTRKVDG